MAKTAICRTCGARIPYVGSPGGEVRKHYWTKHRAVIERGVRKRRSRAHR